MRNISATTKGVITGALMVAFSFAIYAWKKNFENPLQYIVYATYIAGIIWALLDYRRKNGAAGFKGYFSEGFKCFIVVTLMMVLFTWTFISMHPEFKEQMAGYMRTDLEKNKDLVPVDIDAKIAAAKKMFLPVYLMMNAFIYLVIGALIAAIGGGFLSQKANAQYR